jgi:hypothetical protein
MQGRALLRALPVARPLVAILAVLLGLWIACYRFNTLGGALGGFDNDHFVHFALAKQVEAGGQPLRDFLDSGLQGARPSLTYELSALAQRVFGDNLRSEAWLTVTAVAVAGAVTFVAATSVAPWPIALGAGLFSALLSPKLYGYGKVLVLAVACLLVAQYARAPGWRRLAIMSAWTAVAFLFRHDYAVYCGIGFAIAIGASGPWPAWNRAGRVAACGLLALLLLGPSLYVVQQSGGSGGGLVAYLRNGLEMGRRDAQRTTLRWPVPVVSSGDSFDAILSREENTQAWLYYLFLALAVLGPLDAAARLYHGGREEAPAVTTLAVGAMTVVLSMTFLRGSLEARFGDMGPPIAVIGASLVTAIIAGEGRRTLARVASGAFAALVVLVTAACVWSLQSVQSEMRRAGLTSSPLAVLKQGSRVSAELSGLPAALRTSDMPSPSGRTARYLHECTGPRDRVLIVSYAPEVGGLSERLFAGGRATFLPGFYEDERYSRFLLERLSQESVPIALAEEEPYYAAYPLLPAYLRSVYEDRGTLEIDGGKRLRVLTRRGAGAGRARPDGLPCFPG